MSNLTYPCPTCKKEASLINNPTRPFCSDRCRLIDFGAWANEDYKLQSNNDYADSESEHR